ncbi:hypothetical protein [Geobacter metallireducens]|nr:hypothetical protein [Geobacter metallireducens]
MEWRHRIRQAGKVEKRDLSGTMRPSTTQSNVVEGRFCHQGEGV